MCGAKPPQPVAPPEPIPVRDSKMDGRNERQSQQRRVAAEGGIESTMLSKDSAAPNVASPILGG
jgi:hypothetical protein